MKPSKQQFAPLAFSILLYIYPLEAFSNLIVLGDNDDDATLILSIDDQVVIGSSGWVSVQIDVSDTDVPLTAGDSVTEELIDDDGGIVDDSLFSTSFIVSIAEAAAGFFSRIIDAVFDPTPFLPDGDNALEIFAQASVDKDACGFLCNNDDPKTGIANVSFFETTIPPTIPQIVTVVDSDDDATLTLSIDDQVVIGSSDWASIRIEIDENDVPLTLGDTVLIELFDDDGGFGDDLLFSSLFSVTEDEILAGMVDRSFDAIFDPTPFLPDGDNALEIFARASVDKSACGFPCENDDPETNIVSVAFIENTLVPEPSIITLFSAGLLLLSFTRRRIQN